MHPKQKLSTLHVALIIIASLNIGALCLFVCLSLSSQELSNLNYVSVVSTFSVAILTILYVFTTDNQMKIMKSQLDEMQHEHLLKEHPILLINKPIFKIEKPTFYYTPPEDAFSFQSLYSLEASLVNASDDPAIIVRVIVSIIIAHNSEPIVLRTLPQKLSFVSSSSDATKISFHFTDDKNGALLGALRESKPVSIHAKICFKNTSGAHFAIKNSYELSPLVLANALNSSLPKGQIFPKINDIKGVLGNWHTAIFQAPVKYIEVLKQLRIILDRNEQGTRFNKLFDQTRADMDSYLISKDDIVCSLYEDSEAFDFSPISHEVYIGYLKESLTVEEMMSSNNQAAIISISAKK